MSIGAEPPKKPNKDTVRKMINQFTLGEELLRKKIEMHFKDFSIVKEVYITRSFSKKACELLQV